MAIAFIYVFFTMHNQFIRDNVDSVHLAELIEFVNDELGQLPLSRQETQGVIERLCQAYRHKFFGSWFGSPEIIARVKEHLEGEDSLLKSLEEHENEVATLIAGHIDDNFDAEHGITWESINSAVESHLDHIKEEILS